MTADDVRALLKQKIEDAGSQRKFAFRNNLREWEVSRVRRGLQAPSIGVLLALGLKTVETYEPINKEEPVK